MRKSLLALGVAAGFMACDQGAKPTEPLDPGSFVDQMKPGDRRAILREYTGTGRVTDVETFGLTDVMVEKDTTYNNLPAKLVSLKTTEIYPEALNTTSSRQLLVREGDRLSVYTFFSDGYGDLIGLFKRSAFDSTIFADRETVLSYPLAENKPWAFRDSGERYAESPLTKEMVGQESVEFDGQPHVCDVLVLHGLGNVDMKTWISDIGLLKGEIDFGSSVWTDTLGNPVDTLAGREDYRLLKLQPTDKDFEDWKKEYQSRAKFVRP